MNIGIIGVGYVGGAMLKSLTEKSENNNDFIIGYDKYKKIGSFENTLNCDIIFLCLPTLYNVETSSYDKSSLEEICEDLVKAKYRGLIIIKSTVEPTTCQKFADKYNLPIVHNPEFLTARTAYEDFHNQKHVILGKTCNVTDEQIDILVKFYKKNYSQADITICNSTESESIKIFCNSFYAVKIQFFNELYLLCQKLNIDYEIVKNTMLKNNWINPMHTNVPGPDGKLSYGGACFPKDTSALLAFMKSNELPCEVLDATVRERNKIRGLDE